MARMRVGESLRLSARESCRPRCGGLLLEVDVDVVEDFDVVAEEADGLEDDGFVAGFGEGLEGVFDGGADPGGAGDALGLEGEEPVGVGEADGARAAAMAMAVCLHSTG